MSSAEAGVVVVKVLDLHGRELLVYSEAVAAGTSSITINTSSLTSGTYLVKISKGSQEKIQKQVILW